jgi:hypothetical protein
MKKQWNISENFNIINIFVYNIYEVIAEIWKK